MCNSMMPIVFKLQKCCFLEEHFFGIKEFFYTTLHAKFEYRSPCKIKRYSTSSLKKNDFLLTSAIKNFACSLPVFACKMVWITISDDMQYSLFYLTICCKRNIYVIHVRFLQITLQIRTTVSSYLNSLNNLISFSTSTILWKESSESFACKHFSFVNLWLIFSDVTFCLYVL